MRFLADESCDFRIVRALRSAGHDVLAIIEFASGAEDDAVIELAAREDRTFITEDRDFGQLVYAAAKPAPGVILVRYPSTARAELPALMVALVAQYGDRLRGSFAVIQPGRVRIGVIPRD
jgi:predicted nuclease of predicted toxin-antitoxin system